MVSILLMWNRFISRFTKNDKPVLNDDMETIDEPSSSENDEDSDELYICHNRSRFNANFINDDQLCKCCHEISLGRHKCCDKCKEIKHITIFDKPDFTRCRHYADAYLRVKKHCET